MEQKTGFASKPFENEVKSWLSDSGKDLKSGLDLFKAIPGNPYYKKPIINSMERELLEDNPGSYKHMKAISQLIWLLRLYLNPKLSNREEKVIISNVKIRKFPPAFHLGPTPEKIAEIKAWIKDPRKDYDYGFTLLCRVSGKYRLLNRLVAKRSARNEKKLYDELFTISLIA